MVIVITVAVTVSRVCSRSTSGYRKIWATACRE